MKFIATDIQGVLIIELDKIGDDRGFFSRTFCVKEFRQHGLNTDVKQCNLSFNAEKGTLRGMHYQVAPATEAKYIRCVRGSILDVVLDMRAGSASYLEHVAVELTAENRRALYVPENFAHGFITLTDNTEVMYQVSEYYQPTSEKGLRYDDPKLGIKWPTAISTLSDKDSHWPYL